MQASPRPASEAGTPVKADGRSGKYLTFKLGPEEFGVRVIKVREIMAMQHITVLSRMPDYVKWLISLRGSLTCIIVVEVESKAAPIHVRLVVDAVSSVLNFVPGEIENPPESGARLATPFIHGMVKVKGKMKILLDIDRVVSTRDIPGFDAIVT